MTTCERCLCNNCVLRIKASATTRLFWCLNRLARQAGSTSWYLVNTHGFRRSRFRGEQNFDLAGPESGPLLEHLRGH